MPLTADQVLELAKAETPDPAAIQALIDGALAEHATAERAGVDAKNRELLAELADLKPYKTLGKTPDEIKRDLEKARELERKLEAQDHGVDNEKLDELATKRAQQAIDEYRQTIAEARETDRKTREKAEAEAKELRERLDDEQARRMMNLASRGIIDGLEDDVYRRLRPLFVRDKETGAMVIRNPNTGANIQGEKGDITVIELIDGLRSSHGNDPWNSRGAGYFRSDGRGGGESGDSRIGGGRTPPKRKRSEMSIKEKVAFQNEFGHPAYQALPK